MKKEMLQILEKSSMGEKETKAVYTELLNLSRVSNIALAKEAFNAAREETHRPKHHGYNPKGTADDYWDDTYEDFTDWWNKRQG